MRKMFCIRGSDKSSSGVGVSKQVGRLVHSLGVIDHIAARAHSACLERSRPHHRGLSERAAPFAAILVMAF